MRPRQRAKRDSIAPITTLKTKELFERRPSLASNRRWSQGSIGSDHRDWFRQHGETNGDQPLLSPLDDFFGTALMPTASEPCRALSPSTIYDYDLAVEIDEDVGYYQESMAASTSQAVTHISRPPDLAMIAPCPVGSPLLDLYMPAFSEFSDQNNRRALVAHFCNQLSHLMVFREETGNPFTELVLPLTYKSRPVENAIYALASAHLEYRGVKNKEQSLNFHNMAIQGLATMIDNEGKTADRNEMLAAIMLLVYYEVVRDDSVDRASYADN